MSSISNCTDYVRSALTTEYVQTLLRIKAKQLSRQCRFRRWEQPDLEQDMIAYVLKQAHHFDPTRASVNTFIARVVDSAFAMMMRSRRRQKRSAGFCMASLDTPLSSDGGHETTMAALLDERDLRLRYGEKASNDPEKTDLSIDVAQAMADLTPLQRDIAIRLASTTETDVARQLGISRRQVRNAVEGIREHFEKAGLREFDAPGQPAARTA